MELAEKAALITGGGTGVGRATALRLARLGCSVCVNYSRSEQEAEQTAHEVRELGVQAVAVRADVADDAACRTLVKTAVAELGRLDVLVNNAGTTRFVPFRDLERVTDDDWNHILGVNLKGPFQCARAAREAIDSAGGGEIVNVASVAGILATGSSIPYAASKAALINLTVALARVMAPSIRVNAVAPGFITGRWLEKGLGENYEQVKHNFEQASPLGRVCEPDDVAAAIVSLITGSDLVTGDTIICDGGLRIADYAARAGFGRS